MSAPLLRAGPPGRPGRRACVRRVAALGGLYPRRVPALVVLLVVLSSCSGCAFLSRPAPEAPLAAVSPLGLAPLLTDSAGAVAPSVASPLPDSADRAPDAAGQPGPPLEFVHIHVAGAVVRSGVYRLVAGARACDALALAGGETAQACLAAINLASLLVDGQQLYIPTHTEVKASGVAVWPVGGLQEGAYGGAGPGGGGAWTGMGIPPGPLDINRATGSALETLPGIGPVLAARIVAYRAANGPFASVDDLLRVSGIGPAKLADIRSRVTVR